MASKAMVQNFLQVDFDPAATTEILDFLLPCIKLFQPIISIDLHCLPQGRSSSTLGKKYEIFYGSPLKTLLYRKLFLLYFFPLEISLLVFFFLSKNIACYSQSLTSWKCTVRLIEVVIIQIEDWQFLLILLSLTWIAIAGQLKEVVLFHLERVWKEFQLPQIKQTLYRWWLNMSSVYIRMILSAAREISDHGVLSQQRL